MTVGREEAACPPDRAARGGRTAPGPRQPERIDLVANVVRDVVEEVFATVSRLHDSLLRAREDAQRRGAAWRARDVSEIGPQVAQLLSAPGAVPVGMGAILARGELADRQLWLEWWQADQPTGPPTRLMVDLHPASLEFYDYERAEWFAVPMRSGRRHVVGPYVDAHGTDRYVLTFTQPVRIGDRFLGVVGADVPSARLEGLVLSRLGERSGSMLVLGPEGRVVLSTDGRCPVGSLLARPSRAWRQLSMPEIPWRVLVR